MYIQIRSTGEDMSNSPAHMRTHARTHTDVRGQQIHLKTVFTGLSS